MATAFASRTQAAAGVSSRPQGKVLAAALAEPHWQNWLSCAEIWKSSNTKVTFARHP